MTLEDRPIVVGTILAAFFLFLLLMALLTGRENLWLGLGLGVGAGFVYVIAGLFVRLVTVNFSRTDGTVTIHTVGPLGQKRTILALRDVESAFLEQQATHSTGSVGGGRSHSTHIYFRPVLRSSKGVAPLTETYSGGGTAANAVAAINAWLGVTTRD